MLAPLKLKALLMTAGFALFLLDALASGGYIKPGTEASTEAKTRRMIHRMQLAPEDAETWTGMFAKIVFRLRQGPH